MRMVGTFYERGFIIKRFLDAMKCFGYEELLGGSYISRWVKIQTGIYPDG